MFKLDRFRLIIVGILGLFWLFFTIFHFWHPPELVNKTNNTINYVSKINDNQSNIDLMKRVININIAYMLINYQGLTNGKYLNEQDKQNILDQAKEEFKNYWREWRFVDGNSVFIFNGDYILEVDPINKTLEGKNVKYVMKGDEYIFQQLFKNCLKQATATVIANETYCCQYIKELDWYIGFKIKHKALPSDKL